MDTTEHAPSAGPGRIGVVIIGRNEGERLIACIRSVRAVADAMVYVDSGSTDGSVDAAASLGADVVSLDMSTPFTAARARNAGYRRLKETHAPAFVQFVDGDCEIAGRWLETAQDFLETHADVAIAVAHVREKFPERTIYNRLCNREWAGPAGEAEICGGNAFIRASALDETGGYDPALIAGEEPELCVRLREKKLRIYRLDAEMARHDVAMTSLGQWLKRARRAGHAFAEVSHLHRGKPENIWTRETMRALGWSAIAPAAIAAGLALHPAFFLLLLAYPLQVARMALRESPPSTDGWAHAALIVGQKPWEAAGVLQFWLNRLLKRKAGIIEHKAAPDPAPTAKANLNSSDARR